MYSLKTSLNMLRSLYFPAKQDKSTGLKWFFLQRVWVERDFAWEAGAKLCSFIAQAVTINYHHTTGSRAPSLDDDEEEEDRLHAMISMICSRNLTDPNVMKGFYHQWPTSFSLPPFILPLLPLSFHPNCYLVPTSSDPAVRPVVGQWGQIETQ